MEAEAGPEEADEEARLNVSSLASGSSASTGPFRDLFGGCCSLGRPTVRDKEVS